MLYVVSDIFAVFGNEKHGAVALQGVTASAYRAEKASVSVSLYCCRTAVVALPEMTAEVYRKVCLNSGVGRFKVGEYRRAVGEKTVVLTSGRGKSEFRRKVAILR